MDTWLETRESEAFKAGEGFARMWVDIETVKIPAPANWVQSRRWSVFMVGLAFQNDTDLHIQVYSGTEDELIEYLEELLFEDGLPDDVVYNATREFDAMVLEGRFTNARRAHEKYGGPWRHLPQGLIPWLNIRTTAEPIVVKRQPDIESKWVPEIWAAGGKTGRALVAWHCYKDVIQLLLEDPYCVRWLKPEVRARLARDYGSAKEQESWLSVAEDNDVEAAQGFAMMASQYYQPDDPVLEELLKPFVAKGSQVFTMTVLRELDRLADQIEREVDDEFGE